VRLIVSVCLLVATPAFADKKPDVATLTKDPAFAKADRIDGREAPGFVTFTFDDGPNPATTPAVIDALEKYDIPATFFVVSQRLVGKSGQKPRELLARQLAAGFAVGSHSWSHVNLRGGNAAKLGREIDDAVRTLAAESQQPIGLFRAPFGAIDKSARSWLARRGLTEVRWSIDTLDWQARDRERLRKKVMRMILAQNGGVVLMHDVKPITAGVIADVLDDLEAENCKRLDAGTAQPIWPVSLHYFVRDKKQQRAVPAAVQQVTDAYQRALPARCKKRPPVAAPTPATP
jgi:peptidoglycan/xylan/chitin deacetylase (PgdA/CDA1 family)